MEQKLIITIMHGQQHIKKNTSKHIKTAQHVSGDKFAHPQEHFFDCIYSFSLINEKVVAPCWLFTSLFFMEFQQQSSACILYRTNFQFSYTTSTEATLKKKICLQREESRPHFGPSHTVIESVLYPLFLNCWFSVGLVLLRKINSCGDRSPLTEQLIKFINPLALEMDI